MHGLAHRLREDKLYRDYLLLFIGSYFGLRISDLLEIRYIDLIDKKEVIVIEQKTKKQRRITINPKVNDAINFVVEDLKKQDKFRSEAYVFANRWGGIISVSYVNKRLKFIFSKYDVHVQNASSHCLRKTFGKRVFDAAGDKSESALIYLMEIFGHSSMNITKRYIGITDKQIENVYLNL
jgi:integrase